MNIWKVSWKNMTAKPWSTGLSIMLLSLGVGLIALVIQLSNQLEDNLQKNISGIDMVVGAKGSPLQIILSSIFHIDNPTGNIKLEEAESLTKNRWVEQGIPLSYGDSYKGFRIVGSTYDYLSLFGGTVTKGRLWESPMEVVVGAKVAKNLGLKLKQEFSSVHGLAEVGETHNDHPFVVVGILAPTNTVMDQLIVSNLESIWKQPSISPLGYTLSKTGNPIKLLSSIY